MPSGKLIEFFGGLEKQNLYLYNLNSIPESVMCGMKGWSIYDVMMDGLMSCCVVFSSREHT